MFGDTWKRAHWQSSSLTGMKTQHCLCRTEGETKCICLAMVCEDDGRRSRRIPIESAEALEHLKTPKEVIEWCICREKNLGVDRSIPKIHWCSSSSILGKATASELLTINFEPRKAMDTSTNEDLLQYSTSPWHVSMVTRSSDDCGCSLHSFLKGRWLTPLSLAFQSTSSPVV